MIMYFIWQRMPSRNFFPSTRKSMREDIISEFRSAEGHSPVGKLFSHPVINLELEKYLVLCQDQELEEGLGRL